MFIPNCWIAPLMKLEAVNTFSPRKSVIRRVSNFLVTARIAGAQARLNYVNHNVEINNPRLVLDPKLQGLLFNLLLQIPHHNCSTT